VATGLLAIVVLGHGGLDSELSPLDVLPAIAVAIAGATAATTTWNGGRVGWTFQVLLALGLGGFGVWRVIEGDLPSLVGGAVVWLALLFVPAHRRWFDTADAA
jgi:hypothetical protein